MIQSTAPNSVMRPRRNLGSLFVLERFLMNFLSSGTDWDSALYRAERQADTFEQGLKAGVGPQPIKPPVAFDVNQKA